MIRSTRPGSRPRTASLSIRQRPEQLRTADDAVFHHLEEAVAVLTLGERREDFRVDEHRYGLVERAHQVLAAFQVHAGLAADGRVHLRQQSGGDLQHRNAAHEDGRQESRHVVHHAAAEGDDQARPVAAPRHQLFRHPLDAPQPLVLLAAGKQHDLVGALRQAAREAGTVGLPDILGGDDEDLARAGRNELPDPRENAPLDNGLVIPLRRGDGERWHTKPLYHGQPVARRPSRAIGPASARFPLSPAPWASTARTFRAGTKSAH